jgi:predicted  nucleic acid-binding Zn-ribbon protein
MAGQVENLKAFIATLTEASEDVGEVQPGLVTQGEMLETLRQEAADELGGLDSELDDALTALDTLADQTENALAGLENESKGGDDGTLTEAEDAFEQWEKTIGATLDEAASRVARESQELGSRGFDELTSALEAAGSEVDGAQAATEAAFRTLIAALGQEADRFAGALEEATEEAQEAAQQAGQLESAFDQKATQAIEAIQTSSSGALAVHGETGKDTGGFYDEVDGRIRSETQELVADVKAAFGGSAAAVLEAAAEPLDEPVEALLTDALGPFAEEIGSWADQEQETARVLADWDTLVRDLAASIEVIKTIKAMDEAVS